MKCFTILLLLFATSCDAQHPNQYSIPPIPPQTDRTPRTVEYRDNVHLTLIAPLLDTHITVTGKMPENIADKEGKPLLSWRVAVLQYGNDAEVALYKKFKLDEPWDSDNNKKVAEAIPEIYVDPAGTEFTPYLGVTGKTAAFADTPRSMKIGGSKHHAAVVTVDTKQVKIHWTEPKDVSLEDAKKGDVLRWYQNLTNYISAEGANSRWIKGSQYAFDKAVFEFD